MCIIPILAQITQRKKMQDIFDPRIKNIFLESKKTLRIGDSKSQTVDKVLVFSALSFFIR